jgi:hypothetical protein
MHLSHNVTSWPLSPSALALAAESFAVRSGSSGYVSPALIPQYLQA